MRSGGDRRRHPGAQILQSLAAALVLRLQSCSHMLSWRLLSAAVCAWLAAGCTGEYVVVDEGGGGGGGADGGGDPEAGSSRAMFDDQIEPLLNRPRPKGACFGCHQGTDPANGPDFLGPDAASHFDTIRANIRVVGDTPETSLLYTKPDHLGNTWCRGANDPYAGCTADETAAVAGWIELEKGD